jgi:hypothetical protein
MEAAEARDLYSAVCASLAVTHKQVGRRGGGVEGQAARPTRAASSADLGGSSKYSSEILEDRRGEGFHVNSS